MNAEHLADRIIEFLDDHQPLTQAEATRLCERAMDTVDGYIDRAFPRAIRDEPDPSLTPFERNR